MPRKKVIKTTRRLTPKQALFCREYIIDLNGSRAARAAGYSESSAPTILKRENIQERLKALRKDRFALMDISAERTLTELANIAFTNLEDVLSIDDAGARVRKDRGDITRSAIKKIKFKRCLEGNGKDAREVEYIELEMYDKLAALDKLMKHLNLYEQDNKSKQAFVGAPVINFGDTSKPDEADIIEGNLI